MDAPLKQHAASPCDAHWLSGATRVGGTPYEGACGVMTAVGTSKDKCEDCLNIGAAGGFWDNSLGCGFCVAEEAQA